MCHFALQQIPDSGLHICTINAGYFLTVTPVFSEVSPLKLQMRTALNSCYFL